MYCLWWELEMYSVLGGNEGDSDDASPVNVVVTLDSSKLPSFLRSPSNISVLFKV